METNLRLLLGMILILTTSCTEIFKTDLPPIKDCTGDNDICSYADSIQPIFEIYCTRCHDNQVRIEGELDLTSRAGLMTGGVSGDLIDNDDYLNSILLQRITNPNNPMPPAYEGDTLDDIYINMITKWIQAGALDN